MILSQSFCERPQADAIAFRACPREQLLLSRASGSLATFTSLTILPVSSTMQMLVSLTDTSNPAKWSMLRFSFSSDA
jgi:hypothetical protein